MQITIDTCFILLNINQIVLRDISLISNYSTKFFALYYYYYMISKASLYKIVKQGDGFLINLTPELSSKI